MKKWILGSIFTLLLTQSCFAQNTIDDSILIDNLIDLKKIDNKNILASTSTHAINTTEETIGPWTLKCTTKKFPNKFIANRYLNTQQVEIRSCYATQTVYHDSDNQNITAILKITPARILFETRNIIDRHKTPKLIIGEQQRQYTLYANCYNKSSATNTCLLLPEGKAANKAIVREMGNNQNFILKFIDEQTHNRVSLTFTLDNFQDIYPIVENTYKQMREILQYHTFAQKEQKEEEPTKLTEQI